MVYLTKKESLDILATHDIMVNLLALENSLPDMRKEHSDLVLYDGTPLSSAMAIEFSSSKQKKEHSNKVIQQGDEWANALAARLATTPSMIARHENRVSEIKGEKPKQRPQERSDEQEPE